jgi:hypothetical protein
MTRLKEPRLNKYLPTIRIADYSYSISVRDRETGRVLEPGERPRRYWLNVEEYALHEYLIWRAYHWYDMRIPLKIPGFRLLEKLARKMGGEHRGLAMGEDDPVRLRDRIVRWSVMQDLRCYDLGAHRAKHIISMEMTKEQYCEVRSLTMKELDEKEERLREKVKRVTQAGGESS